MRIPTSQEANGSIEEKLGPLEGQPTITLVTTEIKIEFITKHPRRSWLFLYMHDPSR